MRLTPYFALSILTAVLSPRAQSASGIVQGPELPEAPATYELDMKGKRAHIDFNMTTRPISDAKLRLSNFAGRKLIVFYFSAKCPHCQHAFPYIQKLADELAPKGFSSIAIAIKFNSEDDIRGFIRDYKARIPMFQDDTRIFGDTYGTGSVPLIMLVNEKGEYIRYKMFDGTKTPNLIKEEALLLSKK
jgi:thiol-disulfide isomerase/thioredoxin